MKKLFLGVLMAVTAITSPLLMANTNDKNDQQEVINIYFARHGKTLLNSFDRVQLPATAPAVYSVSGGFADNDWNASLRHPRDGKLPRNACEQTGF